SCMLLTRQSQLMRGSILAIVYGFDRVGNGSLPSRPNEGSVDLVRPVRYKSTVWPVSALFLAASRISTTVTLFSNADKSCGLTSILPLTTAAKKENGSS